MIAPSQEVRPPLSSSESSQPRKATLGKLGCAIVAATLMRFPRVKGFTTAFPGWSSVASSPSSGSARCCDVTDPYQAFSQRARSLQDRWRDAYHSEGNPTNLIVRKGTPGNRRRWGNFPSPSILVGCSAAVRLTNARNLCSSIHAKTADFARAIGSKPPTSLALQRSPPMPA